MNFKLNKKKKKKKNFWKVSSLVTLRVLILIFYY